MILRVLLSGLLLLAMPCLVKSADQAADLKQVPSAWERTFTGQVQWQKMTSWGILLVKSVNTLYGIDPADGKILWEDKQFGNLKTNGFTMAPSGPFFIVKAREKYGRVRVFNYSDGITLFDSKATDLKDVAGTFFLPKSGNILVVGVQQPGDKAAVMLYSLGTGYQVWANEDAFKRPEKKEKKKKKKKKKKKSKFGGFSKNLMKGLGNALEKAGYADTRTTNALLKDTFNIPRLLGDPLELDAKSFVLNTNQGVYMFNTTNGKLVWKNTQFPSSSETRFYISDLRPNTVFLGLEGTSEKQVRTKEGVTYEKTYQSYFGAIDRAAGTMLWKPLASVNGRLNRPVFHSKGLIISPQTNQKEYVKLIDYDSGQSLWGKKGRGIKVKGGIVDSRNLKNGIVLTSNFDSAWSNKGAVFFLSYLNISTGKEQLKKPFKVRGRMKYSVVMPTGLLYSTSDEVNILDLKSGVLVLDKPFKRNANAESIYKGVLFTYSNKHKSVYAISLKSGKIKKLNSAPIQFKR